MIHDVVIAGAGPAGAHLAYLLAKSGIQTVLLDQCIFPRMKVCAGGLSPRALQELQIDPLPPVQRRITASCLTWKNRDTIQVGMAEQNGATVLREEFDAFLVERAKGQGIVFFPGRAFLSAQSCGEGMDIETSQGPMQARYLIGADGVYSRVRRNLFGPHLVRFMPALAARARIPGRAMERLGDRWVMDYGGMKGGYGWIFPMRDHVCTGVGTTFRGGDLRKAHRAFMERYDCLKGGRILDLRCSCIPVGGRTEILQKDNAWLIGDAAGLADPFHGEGLFYAFKSASLAAQALVEGLKDRGAPSYAERVRNQILPDLRLCRVLAKWFYRAPRIGFSLGIRNPVFHAKASRGRIRGESPGRLLLWAALSVPFGLLRSRHPGALDGRL
jgi:geranylgeranyl reductase family protein